MKKLILLLLIFPLITLGGGDIEVSPKVVDRDVYLRDSFTFQVSVQNKGDSSFRFYPVVANLNTEGEDFSADDGFSDFISVDRGRMEVAPEESKIMDISFDISGDAEPGIHYGKIFFSRGVSRGGAQDHAKEDRAPYSLVRLEVKENIVENVQLHDFSTQNEINLSGDIDINTEIESIGNTDIKPTGEIIIYNQRTGREVEAISFNEDGLKIESEEREVFKNSADISGLGSFRAELRATYGEKSVRDIQSTTHFRIIPLPLVIAFVLLIVVLTTALIVLVKKIADQNI